MEANKNWAGIAALVLAGLALLVALDGRGGVFGGGGNNFAYDMPMPATRAMASPFAPGATTAPSKGGSDSGSVQVVPGSPDGPTILTVPDGKDVPPMTFSYGKMQAFGADSGSSGGRFSAFVERLFDNIPNLLQLVGLIALIMLALRWFGRRSKARTGPAVE